MSTPMHESHTVTLESANGQPRTYEMRRLSVLKVAGLSLKITSKVLPVFAGLKIGMGDDTAKAFEESGIKGALGSALQFDGGKAVAAICEALETLDEEMISKIAVDLFSTTFVIGQDNGSKIAIDRNSLSVATDYDLGLMLKLAVEVIEFNRFPFIGTRIKEIIGFVTETISGLESTKESPEETPKQLEK